MKKDTKNTTGETKGICYGVPESHIDQDYVDDSMKEIFARIYEVGEKGGSKKLEDHADIVDMLENLRDTWY